MKEFKKIYLQLSEHDPSNFKLCLWCERLINDSDIPYILKSEYDELEKQNEEFTNGIINILKFSTKDGWLYRQFSPLLEKIKQKPIKEILKEVE